MLEDIRKIPNIKKTLERAIFVDGFLYNHIGDLNMMREFIGNNELVRYGFLDLLFHF